MIKISTKRIYSGFISLLLITAIPPAVQANSLDWAGTFLKKHPIAVGTTVAGTTFAWKLSKIIKQRKLDSDLWEATKENNVAKAEQALKMDANANTKGSCNFSVLMLAADLGHQKITKLLIINGADVNNRWTRPWLLGDKFQEFTALMLASKNGHFKVVKLLVNNGADVNEQSEYGETELINSVERLSKFDQKIDQFGRSIFSGSCIYKPPASQIIKVIDELLTANKIEIDKQDCLGWTALMYATGAGLFETTRKLLENGADPYIKNKDGYNSFDLIFSYNPPPKAHIPPKLVKDKRKKEQFKQKMLKIIENLSP